MDTWEGIKREWNIYHYYFTIVVFLIFLGINYFSRDFKVDSLNVPILLSVVTFLFGFLTNINFSMLLKKVHSLKEGLSNETARLVSMYLLSKHLGKEFNERIRYLIDCYTIKTLRDYRNYSSGREFVYEMYEVLPKMETGSDSKKAIASRFLSELTAFEGVREELEYLTSSKMEISMKIANYFLGAILIFLLFINRGDIFTNILFIILSTTIFFIFLIVEDYDDLKIEDYAANISNSEQIFDLIGKERYYPQEMLNRVKLEKGRKYRVSIFDSKLNKEKIFELEYGQEKRALLKKTQKLEISDPSKIMKASEKTRKD